MNDTVASALNMWWQNMAPTFSEKGGASETF